MNKFFVLSYNNEFSVDNSSKKDYEIGKEYNLIGSGKFIGKNKHVFILFRHERKDFIGYAGLSGDKVNEQPWEEQGGKKWKVVYKSSGMHSQVFNLKDLCETLDIDKKVFTTSKRFGHVRSDYQNDFEKVLNHFI